MGDDSFPFVKIPTRYKKIVGVPDLGTRLYRAYGSEEDVREWQDAVFDLCRGGKKGFEYGCVSPGGAAGYARVTRPGVHKKLKSGGLTGFVYHVTKESILFKGKKKLSANAFFYCFIPRIELKAWAEELDKKRDRREAEREALGDGNYNDRYLHKPPKHLKKKLLDEQKKKI